MVSDMAANVAACEDSYMVDVMSASGFAGMNDGINDNMDGYTVYIVGINMCCHMDGNVDVDLNAGMGCILV